MPSKSPTDAVLSLKKMGCFVLCLVHVALALPNTMQKRATAAVPPARIDIPLLFDSNGRYIIPVGMSPGSNEQHFNFSLVTSTGVTAVAGTGCSSCNGIHLYNQSASQTAKPLDASDNVSLVGANYSGAVIKEDCTMVTSNGSAWNYPNQTIVVANSQTNASTFDNGVSGLIGLGTNRISTPTTSGFSAGFNDTIIGQWFNRNLDQNIFQFGMDLSPPVITPTTASSQAVASPTSTSAGILHWLQPDTSAYNTNQVAYKNVQANSSVTYATASQPDWSVQLDGWTFKGTDEVTNSQEYMCSVEPYYTDIYFPLPQAQLINAAIEGSVLAPGLSSLGTQAQAWTIPCDAKFSFTVDIGSQQFTLDQSTLVVKLSDGSCASGIEGWTDPSVDQYLFGALFIQQFYLIFQVGRNGTDSVGFAPKVAVSKGADVGAIVGGTVGGVAGVLLLGVAAFFFIRSRQDRKLLKDTVAVIEEHKAANAVEPYTFGAVPMSPQPQQQRIDHHDDIAPPSYEASELGTDAGRPEPRPLRTAKGEYILPASLQQEGASSSSAADSAPLVPQRGMTVYNIEE